MTYLDKVILWIGILALLGAILGAAGYMIFGKGPNGSRH